VFEQYLTTTIVPALDVKYDENGKISYRWGHNCVEGFDMPLKIYDQKGKPYIIHPTKDFKLAPKGMEHIKIDENYYVTMNVSEFFR
jgi:hypothetical protein